MLLCVTRRLARASSVLEAGPSSACLVLSAFLGSDARVCEWCELLGSCHLSLWLYFSWSGVLSPWVAGLALLSPFRSRLLCGFCSSALLGSPSWQLPEGERLTADCPGLRGLGWFWGAVQPGIHVGGVPFLLCPRDVSHLLDWLSRVFGAAQTGDLCAQF